ncbi:unnamed protein product [Arabidopsis thaliana]|uniref:TIR domain-containing protein n=1 Tax=Arabidopsis thaliana TaxID=3702 RepID=A0A654FR45_ARATH|nr:unnamed protein product [Arabidopsis thaliana]
MDPPSPPPPPIPESRPRPLTPPVLLTRPRPPLPYARPLQPPQSLPPRPRPQVFVSFRGKELRHGFVSHVVKALRIAGVNVFIDSNEMKGRDLQNLFKRIENSKMALVIFSDRFSESDWCLNELVKIDDCVKEGKLTVIPVFYRVNTDDVKNFKGKFGSCFIETLQRQSPKEEPMAERWVNSVKSISSKTGFTSEVHRIDSYLVDAIVRDVKRQLPYVPTKEKELPIETEIFFALVLAGLCNLAPLIFNDTSFYKTPQWFVGVLFLVLIRRKFA